MNELMATTITRILQILVKIFVVNLKHTFSYCLIMTLVTGTHVSFITAVDQLGKESEEALFNGYLTIIFVKREKIISPPIIRHLLLAKLLTKL